MDSTTGQNDRPILVTVEDAARLLSLGRSTVYLLIRRGDLPSVKVGQIIRVPYAALENWNGPTR